MQTSNRVVSLKSNRSAGVLSLAVLLAAGLMLSACNTTNGAGQDISAGGKDLSKAAVDVQKKL